MQWPTTRRSTAGGALTRATEDEWMQLIRLFSTIKPSMRKRLHRLLIAAVAWRRRTNLWRRATNPRPWVRRLRSEKAAPYAFVGSNEATYSLREGSAGFHRNRMAAGEAKPTLSAGIVRRVRN